jgi:uncharacterized phage protein (TIGR02218 family)
VTYEALESSVEGGQPVELYVFTLGATVWRYTSAEDTVVFNSQTYLSRQIARNSPTQATDERRQQLEVSLPVDDPIAVRFIGIPPGQPMDLSITRFHRGDTEAFIFWQGKIVGASYKKQGAQCVLSGITTEGAFSRPIPRFKYQGLCNHVLFDTQCGILKSNFLHTDAVTAVSGNTITVNGLLAAKGAGWALGGFVNYADTDFRLVIGQSGDTLTFLLPFEAEVLGQTVKVQAGCDHTIGVCDSKFSNELNYGGFPFVPTLNPFEVGLD